MKKYITLKDDIEEISLKYHKISIKPIDRSFVSRDFLRLANKFILCTEDEDGSDRKTKKELLQSEVNVEHIVLVLNELSAHVEAKEKQKVLTTEKLNESVKSIDEHGAFGGFLSSFYTEESNVVKVLKCCSQTYIVLFLGSLGVHLYNACKLRAKDMRRAWHLIITKNTKTGIISVTHRRTEQALIQTGNNKLEEVFQFTWEVTMVYTKEMSHFSNIHAKVVDIKWQREEGKDEELEKVFLTVFNNPGVYNLTLDQLTVPVEELRKKKKDLGSFYHLPMNVMAREIFLYLYPKEILTILSLVNSTFHKISTDDNLWSIILNGHGKKMMKFDLDSIKPRPCYTFYKELFTYWRFSEPLKGTMEKKYYSFVDHDKKNQNSNGMFLSTTKKAMKMKDRKNIKPVLTFTRIDGGNPQLFRVHFKTGAVTGGCGVCIWNCCGQNEDILIEYHSDGSISKGLEHFKNISVDNRMQEIEKEDGKKKRVRVVIPLEKDFVFNVFVDPENLKIHYFFNDDFGEKITCSIEREVLEKTELRFGVKINPGQEIVVLPSVFGLDFPFVTRKKLKRMY